MIASVILFRTPQKKNSFMCENIGGCYYVIVRNLSIEKLGGAPIYFIYERIIDFLSMVYHRIIVEMSINDDEKSTIDLTTISNYVLLLIEPVGY